jgi:ABC-type nickel/cobalt efflux system permease component RcnA
MSPRTAVLVVAPAALAAVMLAPARPAAAHPLGNFSVNQYLGLTLHTDRVEASVVVDAAEIPTLQERSTVDADGDGTVSEAEGTAYARWTCHAVAGAIQAQAGDIRLQWTVTAASLAYSPGAGGLSTSRLACRLAAAAPLQRPTTLTVANRYRSDRVGWREITARGDGVRLLDPQVPATSVSDELHAYPRDLLASALDVRSAALRLQPGTGGRGGGPAVAAPPAGDDGVSRWLGTAERRLENLAGGPHLTVTVGLLALLLSLLLGAGHAALPRHGKTVLAAYLAGTRGRPRDAVAVGATVTLSHTAGVLGIGLLLATGTALAGETMLRWLGLVSGAVVLFVGAGMLTGGLRARGHGSGAGTGRSRGSGHHHDGHDHGGHADGRAHDHHGHGWGDRPGRLGLAGIGLAGGLVPSPSALIVLLGAIGLGRTWFGVVLVLAYGLGMAATLTGAGLLLTLARRRLARTAGRGRAPVLRRLAARLPRVTQLATASLVLLVGLGLAARAAMGVI